MLRLKAHAANLFLKAPDAFKRPVEGFSKAHASFESPLEGFLKLQAAFKRPLKMDPALGHILGWRGHLPK